MKRLKTSNRLAAFFMFSTIALALVLPLPSAAGATLDIPLSLTGGVSHFYRYGMVTGIIGMQGDPFTTDLGTLTGMTTRFEAPSGQAYSVNPPGSVSATLSLVAIGALGMMARRRQKQC